MKKTLLALAVLGACAGSAYAQTSITVYGLVDMGYVHDSGGIAGGNVNSLNSGIQSGSRLGFKGMEDLGGGLSAIFTLESGILVDTGAYDSTPGFGRQAFVGLNGDFGTVKLGRQYNPLYNVQIAIDPFAAGLAGDFRRVISTAGQRTSNAVTYATPDGIGGFRAEGLYAFGEQPGDSSKLRSTGLSVGYLNGPVYVSAAYHNANDVTGTDATRNIALGGTYNFGFMKLATLIQTNKNDSTLDTRDWLFGVSAPFGASTVMASYIRHQDKLVTNGDSNQFAIGYSYALSKRTNLYTSVSRLTNESGASLKVAVPGDADTIYNAGIRHAF